MNFGTIALLVDGAFRPADTNGRVRASSKVQGRAGVQPRGERCRCAGRGVGRTRPSFEAYGMQMMEVGLRKQCAQQPSAPRKTQSCARPAASPGKFTAWRWARKYLGGPMLRCSAARVKRHSKQSTRKELSPCGSKSLISHNYPSHSE